MEDAKYVWTIAPCLILFLLPAGIYELRVAITYFRTGKLLRPISSYLWELIYLFLPGTLEEAEESWRRIYNYSEKQIAIASGSQGVAFLLIVIYSVVSALVV